METFYSMRKANVSMNVFMSEQSENERKEQA